MFVKIPNADDLILTVRDYQLDRDSFKLYSEFPQFHKT